MTISKIIKSSAIAAILVVATAGASLAAIGWIDHDSVVRNKPAHVSKKVNWVHDGQKVEVVAAYKSWYRVKIPGQDGWVKKGVVNFHKPGHGWGKGWSNGWGGGSGASFCVSGEVAQFCISGGH
ncbi:MAG TPA: SH3 domain-containing protein [Devosiaceae bacterium]|jgi:SH3-like domain-containing protein|nr:SH3 domain-containing protein [Devosiaceae bacterium]